MRFPLFRCLVVLLLLAGFAPASASLPAQVDPPNPYLVKDINTHTSDGSRIFSWMEAGPVSYFFAEGGSGTPGLWKTDGTPGGTAFVKAVAPCLFESGNPPSISGMLDGLLFFCAGDPKYWVNGDMQHGAELWRTDGTADGTQLVADLTPGMDGSSPHHFTLLGEKLYFVAGVALWRLDTADTPPVHVWGDTSMSGTSYQYTVKSPLLALGDRLYFSAMDPEHGTELWVSDGTPAGTTYLIDLNPGPESSYALPLLANNGRLYFRATDGASGTGLWVFDPALSTTHQITDIAPRPNDSSPGSLQAMGNSIFFQACASTNDCELYRTEGDGAVRLTNLVPGSNDSDAAPIGAIGSGIGARMLFFARADSQASGWFWNLYETDGTPGGETLLRERVTKEGAFFQGLFTFAADDLSHGVELWQTDGTLAGTRLFGDIWPDEWGSSPEGFTRCASRLCFSAEDGDHGVELWCTDGSPENTALAADLNTDVPGSDPGGFTGVGDAVYFVASMGSQQNSLWRSDGTPEGTNMLLAGSDPHYSTATDLTAVGDSLYFVSYDPVHGEELWYSDGTPESTRMVKEINPGLAGPRPGQLTAYQGKLFFTAYELEHGQELWQSDGTEAGTVLAVDLIAGHDSVNITNLQVFDGKLIFTTFGKLWRSDGTPGGTQPVAEDLPQPKAFTTANRRLFFAAGNTIFIYTLWQTDATVAGTKAIPAPACLGQYEEMLGLGAANDWVYFTNIDWDTRTLTLARTRGAEYGVECVWSTHIAGTWQSWGGSIGRLVNYAGNVLFEVPGETGATTVFISDGTAAGTRPFPEASSIREMVSAGPFLYFAGQEDASGRELWVWDGSTAPRLVADILSGTAGSFPSSFYAWNRRLYFSASDGVIPGIGHGAELWAYDIPVHQVFLPVTFR